MRSLWSTLSTQQLGRPGFVATTSSRDEMDTLLSVHSARRDKKYKKFRLEWPDNLAENLPMKKWPANWRISPPPAETIEIGDRWVEERRSPILGVPSAISPDDRNFLLNPKHPDFKRIRTAPPIDYEIVPRLLER